MSDGNAGTGSTRINGEEKSQTRHPQGWHLPLTGFLAMLLQLLLKLRSMACVVWAKKRAGRKNKP
jgi:hypothetical protein